MPDYRRNRVPSGTYFFTVNLLERSNTLLVDQVDTLRDAAIVDDCFQARSRAAGENLEPPFTGSG